MWVSILAEGWTQAGASPPAVWPAQGSSKSHRRKDSLDAKAAGDSVGVVNQELTPFYLYLPCSPGRENGEGRI